MELSVDKKKELEKTLLDILIKSLRDESISEEEGQEIATYVLEQIPPVQTQEQLITFLRALSANWNIFTQLLVIESGEVTEKKEAAVMAQVEKLTESGDIEEAIRIAKQATQNSSS